MASTYLTKSNSSAASTNQYKGTFSWWMKRSGISATNYLIAIQSGSERFLWYLNGNDQFAGGYRDSDGVPDVDFTLNGTPKFRDSNAWYHCVLAYDTTQATSTDRVKFYVNNTQYTVNQAQTVPQNQIMPMNQPSFSGALHIGSSSGGGSYFNGSISHFHFVDGQQLTPSTFGETDSTTGEWKINTVPSVTYGNHGFFILKDGNSVTDQSGNSNNFTVAAGTLTKTEDCPSNVFNTFNPNANNANAILSQGNTTVSHSSTSWKRALCNLGATSGKWYWEVKRNNSNTPYYKFGMIEETGQYASMPSHEHHADNAYGWAWYVNGGNIELRTAQAVISGYSQSDLGNTSLGNGDILCVALDLDNGKLYARKNDGAWFKSADPANNTNGYSISNWSAGKLYIPACSVYENATCEHNFGNGYFGTTAVSSAGTNASNIGIFEYDVPTGFTALSTKGLNE